MPDDYNIGECIDKLQAALDELKAKINDEKEGEETDAAGLLKGGGSKKPAMMDSEGMPD